MGSFWSKSKIAGLIVMLVIILVAAFLLLNWSGRGETHEDEIVPELCFVRLIESLGYIAEEHKITTSDGYILTLTRMINPLIDRKDKKPILFISGETGSGGLYIVNSRGAQPKDFSDTHVGDLSLQELIKKFKDEPSASSLALLASNFARDVWFSTRRGYPTSQGHINPEMVAFYKNTRKVGQTDELVTDCCLSGNPDEKESCDPIDSLRLIMNEYQKTVNRRYWNFTLDDVALTDLGDSINYILAETGQTKLDLVGHSSGGALSLMVLIGRPELQATISNLVLYASTIYQPQLTRLPQGAMEPALEDYIGPFSTPWVTDQITCLINRICSIKYGTLKNNNGFLVKECKEHQIIYMHQNGYPVGSRETTQLLQNLGKKMHHYDYGSPERNMIKYGQPEPPIFNVSSITVPKVSLYYGKNDTRFTPEVALELIKDFAVPVEVHYIDNPKLNFNHMAPLVHPDVVSLVVLPSLKQIES